MRKCLIISGAFRLKLLWGLGRLFRSLYEGRGRLLSPSVRQGNSWKIRKSEYPAEMKLVFVVQHEIIDVQKLYSVVVHPRFGISSYDNHFFETVVYAQK